MEMTMAMTTRASQSERNKENRRLLRRRCCHACHIARMHRLFCVSSRKFSKFMNNLRNHSRITVVTMTGAAIAIDDASAVDTILCVKQCVFAVNPKLY